MFRKLYIEFNFRNGTKNSWYDIVTIVSMQNLMKYIQAKRQLLKKQYLDIFAI